MEAETRTARDDPGAGPLCFLHVPKCAGSSFHTALLSRGAEAICPRRWDWSGFAGFFDFDALQPGLRGYTAADAGELDRMGEFEIVSGHFALPNLVRITRSERIATILREPRARLLSLFVYYRLSPWLHEVWRPYDVMRSGLGPFPVFLADKRLAVLTDNVVSRFLLYGDSRLPADAFIQAQDHGPIADAASRALDSLGLVDVLERGEPVWRAFGEFFGVDAPAAARVNVTGEQRTEVSSVAPLAAITAETLALLEERTAVDSLVYRRVLMAAGHSADEVRLLCDAAFAAQLVRVGDLAGASAASAERAQDEVVRLERERDALRSSLDEVNAELARHQAWLAGMGGSASWRLTAPLRRIKRLLHRG